MNDWILDGYHLVSDNNYNTVNNGLKNPIMFEGTTNLQLGLGGTQNPMCKKAFGAQATCLT